MLISFVQRLTCQLEMSGRVRTASAYRSAIQSIQKELGNEFTRTRTLTPELLFRYEKKLISKGLARNTISFYMRMLRAIYNKGMQLGLFQAIPGLFDHVYTGIDNTPKRAVSAEVFGILQRLDLSTKVNLDLSRDLFLLSFCLQGMSFIDMAYLRRSDLKGSVLTYHRAKTGSMIRVAVPDMVLQIIRKYADRTQKSGYLLPIIQDPEGDVKLQYQSALRTHNRRLKKLAELAGIEENLTSYVARHSWATTARKVEVPIGLISQAMGHKTEEVTRIYLADFDQAALFVANEKILKAARLIGGPEDKERVENYRSEDLKSKTNKNVSHLGSDGQF